MKLGYDRPLYILPFDHRASFSKGLFGFNQPLSSQQVARVAASKHVVYDGFRQALAMGAPPEATAILTDEQFGTAILKDAKAYKTTICIPVEKSGQDEFNFEYGDRWRDHIDAFSPDFVKALVRYNPEGDEVLNRRQISRLKDVSDYCKRTGRHFMFELLVPMTTEQFERLEGDHRLYDHDLRPSLMIASIKEFQQSGVEPDVWKIEGLDRPDDCRALVKAARRDGRNNVGCIVLGRGADENGIIDWLRNAAPVAGFIGFAVGRTSFWDSLVGLRDRMLSREEAVDEIAGRFLKWIDLFTCNNQ